MGDKITDQLSAAMDSVSAFFGGAKKKTPPPAAGRRLGTAAEAAEAAAAKQAAREAEVAARAAQGDAARRSGPPPGAASAAAAAEQRLQGAKAASKPVPPALPKAAPPFVGQGRRLGDTAERPVPRAPLPPPELEFSDTAEGDIARALSQTSDGVAVASTLARVLRNILAAPRLRKYRQLRLSNAAVHAAAVRSAPGAALLAAAGFAPRDAEFLELPLPDGVEESEEGCSDAETPLALGQQLQAVSAALAALRPLLPLEPAPAPLPWAADCAPPGGRCPRVLAPAACAAAAEELPPSFFVRSAEELGAQAAAAAAARSAAQQLSTKAHKARLVEAPRHDERQPVLLRVRLPDGNQLEASFGAREPVAAVHAFVAECLAQPHRTFSLKQAGAPRPLAVDATPLAAAGLAAGGPGVLLAMAWGEGEAPAEGPCLRPQLLQEE